MFKVGDYVVVKDCFVRRWIGLTGVVTDPNFTGSSPNRHFHTDSTYVQIKLDFPFNDEQLGYITHMELHDHRYELVHTPEPNWEV